ncbi:Hsp70 family protein [Arthrobacter sp. MDT2-16]
MSYGLSIDVGTSFTAAAVLPAGGSGAEPRVLPLGSRGASVPTVVFLAQDGTRLVGEVAERRGLAEPGRVAREFKRRMGDSVPLVLGESAVLPEELFVVVVAWVVGVATEREGEPPASITLTHPAGWGEHRTSLLRQALAEAGFHDVVLMTEPEAAALSYASRERVVAGSTLAVYDLGGGTFDATVVRKTGADTFTILGTPQGIERLGGADFDQEVFARVLEDSEAAPADLEQSSPEVLAALTRLRRECAEAKEALSSDSEATVSVMVPGSHTQVRLVRSEFELMVEPALRETVDTLRAALDSADVRPEDLSAILLVGGSSRIPLVAQLLSAEFNRPLAIDLDPKASVALGAAFATVALEAAGDADGAADQQETAEPAAATVPGPLRSGVNAAGFAIPSRKGTAEPHHGPASMASNKRLGVRVAAVAAAVALLGVATATATGNVPSSLTTFGARAEAAQPTSPAATGKPSAAPSPAPGPGVGPLRDTGSAREPGGAPTLMDKVLGAGQGSASASPSAAGTPSRSAEATKRPSAKASDDAGEDAVTPEATSGSTVPGSAAPAPSPSAVPQSGATADPGASPVQPTPSVPFPSADASPTPTDPPTVPVPPTTPPVVDPTPTPTTPGPSPDPTVDPTTPPPSDPAPTDPPADSPADPPADPPTEPASEPTTAPADPAPTDPPGAATEPATAVG